MPLRQRLLRNTLRTLAALALFCIAATTLVTAQQYLLRWRCQRLLADLQSIRLHQTTWAEAQILMHRWGQWGHYDGTCTSTSCEYRITLSDPGIPYSKLKEGTLAAAFFRNKLFGSFYELAGFRAGSFEIAFIVQDGTIWRTRSHYVVEVPPDHFWPQFEDQGSFLQLTARSRDALRGYSPHQRKDWTLWPSNSIEDHPYYLVGRPDGCESCLSGEVNFDVQAPPGVVQQLTNYQFDCLTRRHPCRILEDMLPLASEWHLYAPPSGTPDPNPKPATPQPCREPLWAVGRDAASVLVVDALTTQHHSDAFEEFDVATAKLAGALKNPVPWSAGTKVTLRPYLSSKDSWPANSDIHLFPGQRYLAVIDAPLVEKQDKSQTSKPIPTSIDLDQCGLFPDNPQNRSELQRGFALNDLLRVPEF